MSPEAEKRYNSLNGKINSGKPLSPVMTKIIKEFKNVGWENIVLLEGKLCKGLVTEFYSNMVLPFHTTAVTATQFTTTVNGIAFSCYCCRSYL